MNLNAKLSRIALFLFLIQFINNCAGTPHREPVADKAAPPVLPKARPEPQLTPHYSRKDEDTHAISPLVSQSEHYEQGKNYEAAAAMLERALQLTPNNAELWHRLARIRLKQGQYELAAQFAHKSNSLLRNNSSLEKENEKIFKEISVLKKSGL